MKKEPTAATEITWFGRLRHTDVRTLSPAYFGMVMATGIVSLAANQIGLRGAAWALFAIAVLAYLTLWDLTGLRLYRHPRRVLVDLSDHLRGPGFFTLVAASNILGGEFVILGIWHHVYRRFPLRYDPLYRGAVFPVGMYAVATHQMAAAMGFDFHDGVAATFSVMALGAWALTFIGWLFCLFKAPVEA